MHTHIHAQISHSCRFIFGSSMSIALADARAGSLNKIASIQWNSAIKNVLPEVYVSSDSS